MKDKLKTIWRILRAKSYFYTVHVGDSFVSNYEIGNQPKNTASCPCQSGYNVCRG